VKLAGETQSLINDLNDLTVGKDRTWFWAVLVALVLGLCICAFICRRWRQFKETQDNRSPYEVWVEWEQAREEGKPEQFVPKEHVVNPRSPRGTLPGQGGRFISQRIVDIIPGFGVGGAATGSGSPGRRLDPNATPSGGVIRYDASGATRRPHGSVVELNDLYGRPSDGMGGMRALDRLSDDLSPNPAVLAGISDDEVKAAAAMVSCLH